MPKYGRASRIEPTWWLRGPNVHYRAGWIEMDRVGAELYQPITEEGLVFALASVNEPQDAVEFVRRYGLLWSTPEAEELREPFARWEEATLHLRMALLTTRGLQRAVAGELDGWDLLRSLQTAWSPLFETAATDDEDLLLHASSFVAWLVSEGLKGTEQRLDASSRWDGGDPGGFVLNVHAPHLLAYMYHELAMLLAAKRPLMTCAECSASFPMTDSRQRFCSTTCANRARHRRYRQRMRQKEIAP